MTKSDELSKLKEDQKTLSGRARAWDCNGIETEAQWWERNAPQAKWTDLLVPLVIVAVLFIVGITQSFAASSNCKHLFVDGAMPLIAKGATRPDDIQSKFLCRKLYAVEYNPVRKTSYWSAQKLEASMLTMSSKRVDAFKSDPDLLPSESAHPSDYVRSGYDKGHLAPVGDMHSDSSAMLESFYMSNMIPQVPGNNRDGWSNFEDWVREMTQARGTLYVITGPVYIGNDIQVIGDGNVWVPTHIYKVIYDPKANAVLSVMVPNKPFTLRDLPKYVVPVARVQNATKVVFFPWVKGYKSSKEMWTSKSSN